MNNPPDLTERSYPVLPIKNTVLFPGLFLPLSVGRPNSRAAAGDGSARAQRIRVSCVHVDVSDAGRRVLGACGAALRHE